MTGLVGRIFGRAEPTIADALPHDAIAMAALHAASFRRGWSDGEFVELIAERDVLTHRAMIGRRLVGFIISRIAADEAEILSVAVGQRWQGRGIATRLLSFHLSRLAGRGAHAVFLEVDETNAPARALYDRGGFLPVGRREGYYRDTEGRGSAALVLRRDLT